MIIHDLEKKGLVSPPSWLADNTSYLTIMGSLAYGVSSDASDEDVYGFCMPPKDMVFPHLSGEIPGFGRQIGRFEQWQEHHVKTQDGRKTYDFSVYSIVRYFHLCMENNPNMIDSLFTPVNCVKHITEVGRMVRDRRKMFLHKGAWHKFKGYAYSQVHKMEIKRQNNSAVVDFRDFCIAHGLVPQQAVEMALRVAERPTGEPVSDLELGTVRMFSRVEAEGKRYVDLARWGFDVKFAYHVVRLLAEIEQIMMEGDLDLERNREQLKSIRRGEWSQEQIEEYFKSKEKDLESLYISSKLPHSPDEGAIKQLLMDCLEHHYGSISAMVSRDVSANALVREMQAVTDRFAG